MSNEIGFMNLTYLLLAHDGKGTKDEGYPYSVSEEGGVVDRFDMLAYDAEGMLPGEAEVIVAIYNRFGSNHTWTFIQPIIRLYLDGQKKHEETEIYG